MRISMEVFSVINLTQFKYYQESFGYLAQQLNFPKINISS